MQACGVSLVRLLRPVAADRRPGTAATAYEIIVALPERQSDVPRNHVRRRGVARREQRQAARLLRGLPEQGHLRPRPAARRRLARRVPGRHAPGPTRRRCTSRREGASVSIATKRIVAARAARRHAPHRPIADKPDEYEGTAIRAALLITLDPETVFPRPPREGRPRDDDRGARADDRRRRQARRSGVIGARFMMQQKFSLPVDLPDPGAHRPRARRQQPQGRQARELRARHRRHLRLLRAALVRARRRWAACSVPNWRRGCRTS